MNDICLITKDNQIIEYQINKLSSISKVFDDNIKNKTSNLFHKSEKNKEYDLANVKYYSYPINVEYKILDWILNKYYVDKYFYDHKKLRSYIDTLLNNTNKILLIDIYMFSIDMNILQLKFDLECYMLNDMITYFMPNTFEQKKIDLVYGEDEEYSDSKEPYLYIYNKNEEYEYVINNIEEIYKTYEHLIKNVKMEKKIINKIHEKIFNIYSIFPEKYKKHYLRLKHMWDEHLQHIK